MRRVAVAVVFLLCLAGVTLLQWRFGAFGAALCSDAALHLMTGVMFRDYLIGGIPGNPLRFLLDYFGHYQMLGLGHWPPAFHGLEALWFLVVGVGKAQALLLVAAISAALAATAFAILRPRLGLLTGLIAAALVVTSPLVQTESAQVMLDVACGWLCLLAALCFANYLEHGRWRDSVLFGAISGVALLTKGNTALLALVPPLALLLTNRWRVLAQPSLWVAPVVVVLIAAPFYLATYGWSAKGFVFASGWAYTNLAIRANATEMWQMFGAGICALALVGFATRVLRLGQVAKPDPLWATLAALILATFIFQAAIPVAIQARYLAPMVVPVVALALAGVHDVLQLANLNRRWPEAAAVAAPLIALVLLAGPVLPAMLGARPDQCRSLEPIAVLALKRLPANNPVVLIGAHAFGEQAFATEIVLRDPKRPSMVVAFGSRLFGADAFMNDQYAERYATDAEVEAVIDELAIPYVAIDLSRLSLSWGHNQRLLRIAGTRGWQLQESVTGTDGTELRLYRIEANAARPTAKDKLSAALGPKRRIPGGA